MVGVRMQLEKAGLPAWQTSQLIGEDMRKELQCPEAGNPQFYQC